MTGPTQDLNDELDQDLAQDDGDTDLDSVTGAPADPPDDLGRPEDDSPDLDEEATP